MRNVAIACWYIAALLMSGKLAIRGAIALPSNPDLNSRTGTEINWEADIANGVLLYPDDVSNEAEPVLIYPDVSSPQPLDEADEDDTDHISHDHHNSDRGSDRVSAENRNNLSREEAIPPRLTESSTETGVDDEEVLFYPDVVDGQLNPSNVSTPGNNAQRTALPTPLGDINVSSSASGSTETLHNGSVVADVQIQGGDHELKQIVQDVISARVGDSISNESLEADRMAIAGTGLVESVNISTMAQSDGIAVVYDIQPIVVRSFSLTGAQALSTDIFNEAFENQVNQPISPQLLNQGADEIDAWYLENGYTLSKVVAWLTDPSGHVTVEVLEPTIGGIEIEFVENGSVLGEDGEPIEGRTRKDFILRELEQQPGDAFNQDNLVQDVETLLSLGIFQDASVELTPDEAPENPTIDVLYRLEEGFARTFRVGGGISTELGLFGSVTYRDRNFRGIGEEVNLGVQAGGRGLEFNTGFTSPYRDSNPNRLGYSVNGFRRSSQSLTFSDEVPLANGDDARERRFGGGGSVMRPLGEWDAELGIDYARVSIRDDDGDIATEDALGNRLTASDSGIDDLLTVGFRVTQDRRLNPNNPAGGSVLRLGTEQSLPVGNGSILMNRLTASYAQYLPTDLFGSGSLRNPEVFAFNVQGGTILGDLPPYEAFDLGGMNSVRGYRGGDVGSGRSYILAAAEYRFPLVSTLGGVLFTDFASDLGSGGSVEGDPAGSRDKPGTGLGYGFGLRFGSPIGLIRADFGFNDQGDNRFHFGFGQRF